MSKATYFFATSDDIKAIVQAVEKTRPLRYTPAGMSNSKDRPAWDSALEIQDLGKAVNGDVNHEAMYLVVAAAEQIAQQVVPQRQGGERFAVYQDVNPASVILQPGGLYRSEAVIRGELSTCTDHPISHDLFKLFAKEIQRRFIRVNQYYLGPSALSLFDHGYRLTASVNSPVEYDVQRNGNLKGGESA